MSARVVASADVPTEPTLSENSRTVLEARYLKKNAAGECVETAGTLFWRVASTMGAVEAEYGAEAGECHKWSQRFYDLMTSGDFMPNSPTLMNAGREMGMLSACFVLPVRDSINEIFNSIKHTALIQKAGGGTGFAFDELRPTGDFIKSSGGTTSGPISFWRAFSEATNAIQQGAFRRGANMGMMYIHHPDILKFLHAKQDLSQFTNYNISIKVTDTWMAEFLADPDSPHVVRNPRGGRTYLLSHDLDIWKYDIRSLVEIDGVKPLPDGDRAAYFTSPELVGEIPEELRGRVYTKRDIWDIIVKNAWQTGEPGVVFIDRINATNPTPHVGRMEATNPCGEQPLLPYEACNLGSINLGNFITNECRPEAMVDWDRLRQVVHLSTRFLDNVIDANNYPLDEIDRICKANRKIGIGVMGFADALFKLGVAYNSESGVEWGERFMQFVNDEAHNCSEMLARERGCFPNWKGSTWQTQHKRMMRNACTTTVAPTGTISIIANCSGGIEPMFSLAFIRNVLRGHKQGEKPLVEVNETFRRVAQQRGFLTDELLERIAIEGTLAHIDEAPDDIKRVFVCAHDIAPEWHMLMQAGFQRHNDSSISKTINFPHEATVADVEKIYRLAFEHGCKGVTVYRDGCREFQPMALKDKEGATKRRSDEATKEETEREAQAREPGVPLVVEAELEAPVAFAERGVAAVGAELEPVVLVPPTDEPVAPADEPVAPVLAPVVVADRGARVVEPDDLPEIVSGLRIRQMTPFGNMHVKITVDPKIDRELEVFAQLGKGGDVATSDLEAICRMISLWLRAGGTLRHVIKQLEGIGSSLQIPTRTGRIMSLGDGLAAALKKYQRAKERFGLRPLLLGDVDLSELDKPLPGPGSTMDRPLKANGSGNGNGHGNGSGNGKPGNGNGNHHGANGGNGSGGVTAAKAVALVGAATASLAPRLTPDAPATAIPAGVLPTASAPVARSGASAPAVALVAPAGSLSRVPRDKAQHYKVMCPECGSAMAMQEGCRKCHGCGWSAC
jgi:ribonucleoside-diphosphate reductase alpha chain